MSPNTTMPKTVRKYAGCAYAEVSTASTATGDDCVCRRRRSPRVHVHKVILHACLTRVRASARSTYCTLYRPCTHVRRRRRCGRCVCLRAAFPHIAVSHRTRAFRSLGLCANVFGFRYVTPGRRRQRRRRRQCHDDSDDRFMSAATTKPPTLCAHTQSRRICQAALRWAMDGARSPLAYAARTAQHAHRTRTSSMNDSSAPHAENVCVCARPGRTTQSAHAPSVQERAPVGRGYLKCNKS